MSPLARQTIDIPFGGLETLVEKRLVQPGKTLVLQDAEFLKPPAISKRNGYTATGKGVYGGSTLSAGKGLAAFRDALLLADGASLYASTGNATTPWVRVGAHFTGVIKEDDTTLCGQSTIEPLSDGTTHADATNVDFAVLSGIALFVATYGSTVDATGRVEWSVVDMTTRSVLARGTVTDLHQNSPAHVVADATRLHLVYVKSDHTLNVRSWNPSAIVSTAPSEVSIYPLGGYSCDGLAFELGYSASVGYAVALVKVESSNHWFVVKFDATGVIAVSDTFAYHVCTGLHCGASGKIAFLGFYQSGVSSTFILNSNLTTAASNTISATVSSTAWSQAICMEYATNSFRWWSTFGKYTATLSASAKEGTIGFTTLAAASKPFTYNGRTVAWFTYIPESTSLQSGYLLIDLDNVNTSGDAWIALMVGKAFMGNGITYTFFASNRRSIGCPGAYTVGAETMCLLLATPGSNTRRNGYFATLDSSAPMRSVETPNGTVITGLLPAMYDGVNLTEVSPVLYPDMANVAQSAGAGTIPAGTYYVIAMFEYTLANSSVIRGITSVPATVTVDGSHSISFVYRYATFRDYEHPTIQSVKIYVSSDDAVYYLQKTYGPGCVGVGNVPDYSTTTEQLYTVGGVLDNGCPPSLLDVITRNNRLYGVDSRGQIYYTKELVSTIAPEWSEYLVKSLRPDGGSYWQLAALDDRMLAFGTGSIQVLTGDGLDSAGASDTLSSPTVLPVDAGIIANSPVAVSEDGVWCKSSGVIYLLDRSLSLQKVGSPVSGIAYTLVSVALVPVKRQIRFGHSDGSALVFDTLKKEWSEFRNHTQVAAINNGGVYTLLKSDGTVWFQSSGYVDGDGAAIGMTIEIPWLHIGALQGVQRLYWANLIGEYLSSISLAISTYHDGAATATETVTYAKTSGTAGDQLEVRHADGRRCESIKIKIVDTSSGAGATLVGFTMEIGARAGTKRHASSQTV